MEKGIVHIAVIIKMNSNSGMALNSGDRLDINYFTRLFFLRHFPNRQLSEQTMRTGKT